MIKIVAFLQNAWSPVYAGGLWPRDSWLRALERSRSGQRISVFRNAAVGVEWWFDNTTPIVGDTPDSVVPADAEHIRTVLAAQAPDVVVTFGRLAKIAVAKIATVPIVSVPHPAHRLVTNALYRRAGKMISGGVAASFELRQRRRRSELIAG